MSSYNLNDLLFLHMKSAKFFSFIAAVAVDK